MPPTVLEQSDAQMAGDRANRSQKGTPVRPGVPQGQGAPKTGKENEDSVKAAPSAARSTPGRQAERKPVQDVKKADKTAETPSTSGQTVSSKAPQATAEQLRMAQMFQNSSGKDLALQEKAQQVMELTGCSSDDAIIALHDTGNDTEAAVNLLLEGGELKSEWETTGKKGKKVPKAKKDQETDERSNVPFGMGRGRGRQQQRSTSNRGGKVSVQTMQKSGFIPQDAHQNSSNGAPPSRSQQPPNRDRPASPVNKSVSESRVKGGGDPSKGRGGEHSWEDTDDDWKEDIRETKVFTRSSAPSGPPQPFGGANPAAQQTASTATTSGPTFSAMVQKQTAWTGNNPSFASTPPRPTPDNAGWRPMLLLPAVQPHLRVTQCHREICRIRSRGPDYPVLVSLLCCLCLVLQEGKSDVAQINSQLGSLTFNRSLPPLENSANQFSSPSQSQTFSSRNTFANAASDSAVPSAQEFGSTRNEASQQQRPDIHAAPINAADSVKSQTFQNAGAFAGPMQSKTFTNSQNDMMTNTYSARNIQNAPVVSGPVPTPQHGLTAAGPAAFGDGVFSQDVRANPSSAASLGMQKPTASPQSAEKFSAPSAFVQQSPQRPPQTANQAVSPSTGHIPQTASQAAGYPATSHAAGQQMPSASPVKPTATTPTSMAYGNLSSEAGNRNSYSGFQSTPSKESAANLMPQATPTSLPTTVTVSPQRSMAASSTTPVYSTSKAIPSTSMSSKSPYGGNQPNVTQSVMNQPFIQQQPFPQQNTMQMFHPMYSASLDGMNDPRLHNVMQPAIPMDYSYQGHMQGRDNTLGYSSTSDYKYRNDSVLANQQVQVSQQQGLVGPHQMNQYPGPYQVFSPPVAQNFQQYTTQMYSGMQSNYPKGSGGLGNSYSGNTYGDMSGLGDVTRASNTYVGLRGQGNETYAGSPGMLSGADLQSGYYNKPVNKFDKPSPGFGMPMGNQQPGAYATTGYFPIMTQQAVHPIQQPVQQVSAMNAQNVSSNKQNKGPQAQYWGHQGGPL
ncbi:ubiquitin-associated protein 2-like [Paramacrobiotus metropolitanus]|uniref:ubiquitin-associated protein 2-like n=1 Tax=Paramacrobiotus metropolitanus TaxID=2943436 RepID=UPI00244574AE|nr:ubiquitin-associated protein 2-like [Paramacrobiotus metropolitanus]